MKPCYLWPDIATCLHKGGGGGDSRVTLAEFGNAVSTAWNQGGSKDLAANTSGILSGGSQTMPAQGNATTSISAIPIGNATVSATAKDKQKSPMLNSGRVFTGGRSLLQ